MQIDNQKYKYFIYCRKSNGNEKSAAPSIDGQFDELIAYAQKESLNIVGVFKEVRSAFKKGRPKFNEMLERIKSGDANALLSWEVSRISRNMQDASLIDELVQGKYLLKIQTPGKDYIDNNGGDLMYNIENVMSRQYSKEISLRVKRGINRKISKKEWPGTSPLGYLNINKDNAITGKMDKNKKRQLEDMIAEKCKKENRQLKRIELDPLKAPLIKKIFEDFSTGNYSIFKTIDIMNEIGLNGKSGRPVSKNCVINMLQNPFYYGNMLVMGEEYEGNHEALINKTLFNKVQEALKLRNKPLKRKKGQFEFTGFIKCGECGCGITGYKKIKHNRFKGKTSYIYYGCTHMRDRLRRIPCKQTATTGQDLKKQFEKQVKKIQINEMVKELLNEAIKRSYETEKELNKRGIQEWENMFKNADNKMDRLFELYNNQAITVAEFKTKKEEIMHDKQKAKEHLEAHGEAQKAWFNYSEKLIVTTDHVYKIFKQGTPEQVRMLMTTLGKNYVLENGTIRFQFKEPYNYLVQLNESRSSNKYVLRGRGDLNP